MTGRCNDCAPGVLCDLHARAWAEYTDDMNGEYWA